MARLTHAHSPFPYIPALTVYQKSQYFAIKQDLRWGFSKIFSFNLGRNIVLLKKVYLFNMGVLYDKIIHKKIKGWYDYCTKYL